MNLSIFDINIMAIKIIIKYIIIFLMHAYCSLYVREAFLFEGALPGESSCGLYAVWVRAGMMYEHLKAAITVEYINNIICVCVRASVINNYRELCNDYTFYITLQTFSMLLTYTCSDPLPLSNEATRDVIMVS